MFTFSNRNTCPNCGTYFADETRTYCTDECRIATYRRKSKEKREAKHPPIIKICQECGKEFRTITYNEKFCGTYCKGIKEGKLNLEKWANKTPKKRKRQNLQMQIFYQLGDKPSDSALKKCNACRG